MKNPTDNPMENDPKKPTKPPQQIQAAGPVVRTPKPNKNPQPPQPTRRLTFNTTKTVTNAR